MSNHPRPWHRGSIFGDGHRVPMDRERRAVWKARVEIHRKAGRITDGMSYVALALLKRLGTTGRCDPSHAMLAADAGCKSAKTAERATAALKALGLLTWVRRLVRSSSTSWRAEQTSNQYVLVPALASLNAPIRCGRYAATDKMSLKPNLLINH